MPFKKPTCRQKYLKQGYYGLTGSGKTLTALLVAEGLADLEGKRIAMVDTELGSDFYIEEVPERVVHPGAFDIDRIETKSLMQVVYELEHFDASTYGVVILDSVSHLWDTAIESYKGKRTSTGGLPYYAWGKIKEPWKKMMALLLDGQFHSIICGRQKNVFGEGDTGEMTLKGVTMRAENEAPYEPHMVIRMLREYTTGTELAPIRAWVEKDRSGVLSGKTIELPSPQEPGYTFGVLAEPVLGALRGERQGQVESVEEAAMRDAEAHEVADHKAKVERENFVLEMSAAIASCGDMEALEKLGERITPQVKARIGDSGMKVIRAAYKARLNELAGEIYEKKREELKKEPPKGE